MDKQLKYYTINLNLTVKKNCNLCVKVTTVYLHSNKTIKTHLCVSPSIIKVREQQQQHNTEVALKKTHK